MKKIFYCLLLAVMLSSCGGETKKSEAKQESNPNTELETRQESIPNAESETKQESIPNAEPETKQEPSPEVAVEKQVGDIIMVNGAMGIVYAVTPDGQHGMVVSVEQGDGNWEEIKQWCAQYGNGWQLPSKDELLVIYKQKNVLDPILEAKEYTELYGFCWSSTEYNSWMWVVSMYDGGVTYVDKRNFQSVRAVCEF